MSDTADARLRAAPVRPHRIDLAAVVSKYIGETEKALARVFDAAERLGAVLLVDEADALFGQRSSSADAHDRSTNLELGCLLLRLEIYRSLVVLTTSARSVLDPAPPDAWAGSARAG